MPPTGPARPLTMINPFAPGGPNDVVARLFAQRMGEILGQSVIVENVGGAGDMNGASRAAKAEPDGYTFLQGTVGTQAQIGADTVKPIAILSKERSPALPNVPTAMEQGFDVDAYTWNAFFLPKGTPEPIVRKLRDATVDGRPNRAGLSRQLRAERNREMGGHHQGRWHQYQLTLRALYLQHFGPPPIQNSDTISN
jgi:tripartite-type tricarboxylate transporter receptor subunit TctC